LTTGAITGIIDRLEQAGYIRRTNDSKDRRRTIVESTRNRKLEKKIEVIFMPFHERMHNLLSSYSDSGLVFLLDATTEFIEQYVKNQKNYGVSENNSSMKRFLKHRIGFLRSY
jgi:DNA-binding MarR family transcriptional regulator